MKIETKTIAIVAGVALAAYLLWRAKGAIGEVLTTSLNPASDQNLAYKGVNSIGGAVTGDKDFSLGSYLYDLTHADYDPNAKTSSSPSLWASVKDVFGFGTEIDGKAYAPGDVRTEYVTRGPGAAPVYDYSLDSYLRNGSFPTPGAPR